MLVRAPQAGTRRWHRRPLTAPPERPVDGHPPSAFPPGLLLASGIGILLNYSPGWRWLLSMGAYVGLVQMVLMWTVPER